MISILASLFLEHTVYTLISASKYSTLWSKKLNHFIFAIILLHLSNNYWYTYTLITVEQNDIKIINLLWRVSLYTVLQRTYVRMQRTYTCYKRHHYCLENLNVTAYKVWKCIHQQRNALVKYIRPIKCFSCLPLPLSYVLSLRHWSTIWSMTVCWMLDQPLFRCRLNSSTFRTKF